MTVWLAHLARPFPHPAPPQVSLGSLAIVAGLVVGGVSANRTAGAWVAGVYELARLPLVAGLIWWHRRENLAGP